MRKCGVNRVKYLAAGIALISITGLSLWFFVNPTRRPRIAFPDGRVFDFGIVNEGESIQHHFRIANQGKKTLQIMSLKTACACTGAKIEDKELRPGEHTKVTISYKGRRTREREVLPIWIVTNDPEMPVAQYTLNCNVRVRVFWYPAAVSIYSSRDDLGSIAREVRFVPSSGEKLELIKVTTSSEGIKAIWEEDDAEAKCIVRLTSASPQGNSVEEIRVLLKVGAVTREIVVPVNLMIHDEESVGKAKLG